jgi:hypothetical protein
VWDKEHRTEIALLGDDGRVHLVFSGESNVIAGDHRGSPLQALANRTVGASVSGRPHFRAQLVRAKVSSLPTDDLVVLDRANHQRNDGWRAQHHLRQQRGGRFTRRELDDLSTRELHWH